MSNEELAVAYQRGDGDALLPLWMQVEKLATKMIRPYIGLAYRNRAVDYDDLLQSAFLAVERAARAYRASEGGFTTVMGFYVKSEMAALLGLRGRMRTEHYEAVSTSTPLGGDGAATVGDTLPDDGLPSPDEGMFQEDVRREVRAAVDRLPVEQAQVVRRYYLEGTQQNTIAAQLGVSPERARQIKRKGWNGLRKDRRLRGLADDLMGAACYWHKGLAAYHRDWTSTVERAVIGREGVRERLRREAVRRGISEGTLREWGSHDTV